MFISGFMIGIYVVVALLAALTTLVELRADNRRDLAFGALGLLACLFWPVTLLMVIFAAQRGPHGA